MKTKHIVYRFHEEAWPAKDVCFITANLMIIVSTRIIPGQTKTDGLESKVSLIALNDRLDKHTVLYEIITVGAQFDGCHVSRDIIYVADQANDVIHRYQLMGEILKRQDDLEGFSFPHGVDVSADGSILAVTNYGPNTVSLRSIAHSRIKSCTIQFTSLLIGIGRRLQQFSI
ncbi:MAG: YncE family protein [Methylococcales bacterium]